ncbi:AraC family transcriptional regulator N-terminal domain-containing protein [Chitinophaga sp. GCM10012297]|uniref:AraC family transcriptional regulator n=1 Tax=Chitinophaga chungangae TaxID=2821488 RepID=A0ABS3YBL9_9BACT|nr:AraC family transcriptional regulator [Chitinophaga chungangae]MBO9152068.1 AraC family transcriptional regulator [Chitinophaga chungangae]
MARKSFLEPIELTPPKHLRTLVENRRVFNLNNCELNVFECYEKSFGVPLSFNDFLISSMVRGKKVMHLPGNPSFDYLPGETVIFPANQPMEIDFPDAAMDTPTQCIALAVDGHYVRETVNYLNNYYQSPDENSNWKLQFNTYHFENDDEISGLINKLIRICSSGDTTKNIFADLNLKELLIRLMQSQHMQQVVSEARISNNHSRQHFVLNYIREHLTEKIAVDTLSKQAYLSRNIFFKWFREQFGITPLEYINRERVSLAKQLLSQTSHSVSRVSDMCGFSDVNYFIRVFKKTEGITPRTYQIISSDHNRIIKGLNSH